MRTATVVLPVPGLPVKLMCNVGVCEASPNFDRTAIDQQERRDLADALLDRREANEFIVKLLKHRTHARLRELFRQVGLHRRSLDALVHV